MFNLAKILLACHQFFPRYYTGTETLTLEVAEELRRRQHEVAVITTEPVLPGDPVPEQAILKKDIYEGFSVWRLFVPNPVNPVDRLNRESDEEPLRKLFDGVLDEFSPNIVHSFHLMRLTLTFVECIKERGIPFFLTVTDFWLICPTYQLIRYDDSLCRGQEAKQCFVCLTGIYTRGMNKIPIKFRLAQRFPWLAARLNKSAASCQKILEKRKVRNRYIMELTNGVIWANNFIQDVFHKNGMSNNKEQIISFPIPERAKGLFNLPLASTEGALKVAFIGTLRHSKGPQVLLEACEILAKDDLNKDIIEVYIWGAGDNEKFEGELKKSMEKTEWVHFCGVFPQESFPEVLKDIHVVVIPSLWYENTPLTALSALAANRVLIVSDLGGLSTIIEDKVSGFTFPAGDAKELASILMNLARNKHLVEKIAKFTPRPGCIENYVDKVLAIYNVENLKTVSRGNP